MSISLSHSMVMPFARTVLNRLSSIRGAKNTCESWGLISYIFFPLYQKKPKFYNQQVVLLPLRVVLTLAESPYFSPSILKC